MSRVVITLEDASDAISAGVNFQGGFNPLSHAHQHAQILLRMMDELCTKGEVTPEPAPTATNDAVLRLVADLTKRHDAAKSSDRPTAVASVATQGAADGVDSEGGEG